MNAFEKHAQKLAKNLQEVSKNDPPMVLDHNAGKQMGWDTKSLTLIPSLDRETLLISFTRDGKETARVRLSLEAVVYLQDGIRQMLLTDEGFSNKLQSL